MLRKARVLILAVMTAAVMLLGSTAVFAADEPSNEVPEITKTVTIADGVTMPETTFTFHAELVDNADGVVTPTTEFDEFDTSVTKNEGSVNKNNNTFTVALDIPEEITSKTGEYTYKLTETSPTLSATKPGWTTVDTDEFYLHIYVKNDKSVLYSITATNDKGATKTDAEFQNTYEKDTTLEVLKTVVNPEYVDESLGYYEFTITFSDNSPSTVPATITGTIGAGSDARTVTISGGEGEFSLADGETISFVDLPVGITYTLTETQPADSNWKETSISAIGDPNGEVSGELSVIDVQLGEEENTAEVTNTYNEVTLTGIVTTYLPYIAMILLAIAALALYVVSKRRRAARY